MARMSVQVAAKACPGCGCKYLASALTIDEAANKVQRAVNECPCGNGRPGLFKAGFKEILFWGFVGIASFKTGAFVAPLLEALF